jgi:hypothetical protein
MPGRIVVPDPESTVAYHSELRATLYMKDLREEFPLYRYLKVITQKPWAAGKRTAHLTWIVHHKRLQRGGDSWRLLQASPAMYAWIEAECAKAFDAQYVKDTFGLDDAGYLELVAREEAKYA